MEQFLRIGVVTTTHGLAGEVKVYPTTDSPRRFKEVKKVILKTPKGDVETEIEGARFFKNLVIVKLACFDNVDQVKNLHGTDIMIDRAYAQPLEEGEYYIADLIGCRVVSDEGIFLGNVKDVLQTGANDVYLIDTEGADLSSVSEKAREGKAPREILLPVIPDCIKNVDIEDSTITVHLMKGLVE